MRLFLLFCFRHKHHVGGAVVSWLVRSTPERAARVGGGVLPYMGYIGMCGPKGYGFSAVFVINRVSNLADSGHK